MTRTAFESCRRITYVIEDEVRTARVVSRVRPAGGLRKLRTADGDLVRAIDVISYR